MPHESIENIDIGNLLLDEKNPRLPSSRGRKQRDMLLYIARKTSITEIMSAIAENNYFPGEPLVVLPTNDDKYVVVEGNRRLTALMLLQDPSLYPKNRRVQEIAETADFRPNSIPCVIFESRDEVVNYLGYRHITGVKQWEPLSKARYIGDYFRVLMKQHTESREVYREVAQAIGSRGPYIKRQLDALAVYNILEENEFFKIEGLDEENISFSLLSTALGYESILTLISDGPDIYAKPESIIHDNVKHLCSWLYEPNEQGETILGESRNIQRLAMIAADTNAIKRLIEGDSLDKAYSVTKGISDEFTETLIGIENAVTRAVSIIALVDVDEGQEERITNISKQVKYLRIAIDSD